MPSIECPTPVAVPQTNPASRILYLCSILRLLCRVVFNIPSMRCGYYNVIFVVPFRRKTQYRRLPGVTPKPVLLASHQLTPTACGVQLACSLPGFLVPCLLLIDSAFSTAIISKKQIPDPFSVVLSRKRSSVQYQMSITGK